MIRRWLIRFGLWLARWAGAQVLACDPVVMDKARQVVREIERQAFKNGEQKRHNALTAMLNHFPGRERDCAAAIEAAVQERG